MWNGTRTWSIKAIVLGSDFLWAMPEIPGPLHFMISEIRNQLSTEHIVDAASQNQRLPQRARKRGPMYCFRETREVIATYFSFQTKSPVMSSLLRHSFAEERL
mmetsp:Transcript_274/g.522  ORF Transcript_274/g.522 Transcript_274/m.522 type:complete len:103 (+) Transcript_274:470-778(+)